jgi:hypothetical protein
VLQINFKNHIITISDSRDDDDEFAKASSARRKPAERDPDILGARRIFLVGVGTLSSLLMASRPWLVTRKGKAAKNLDIDAS